MGFIQTGDVSRLLQDKQLVSDIAQAVVETPAVLEALADDIAEDLEEELENAPELRKAIIDAAMASGDFRRTLATKLMEEIDD